jgi:hypothetical protein
MRQSTAWVVDEAVAVLKRKNLSIKLDGCRTRHRGRKHVQNNYHNAVYHSRCLIGWRCCHGYNCHGDPLATLGQGGKLQYMEQSCVRECVCGGPSVNWNLQNTQKCREKRKEKKKKIRGGRRTGKREKNGTVSWQSMATVLQGKYIGAFSDSKGQTSYSSERGELELSLCTNLSWATNIPKAFSEIAETANFGLNENNRLLHWSGRLQNWILCLRRTCQPPIFNWEMETLDLTVNSTKHQYLLESVSSCISYCLVAHWSMPPVRTDCKLLKNSSYLEGCSSSNNAAHKDVTTSWLFSIDTIEDYHPNSEKKLMMKYNRFLVQKMEFLSYNLHSLPF